jgi:predicted kinase
LVLVGGLPGSGKSTLARGFGEQAGFTVIRSDLVRKELAGIVPNRQAVDENIYTLEWTERTYAECLRRVDQVLFEGGRALVDASFIAEGRRHAFLDAAARWGVSAQLFICHTDSATAHRRLQERRGDPSDADWSIHQLAVERWEELGPQTKQASREIPNVGTAQEAIELALGHLRTLELQDERVLISTGKPTVPRG